MEKNILFINDKQEEKNAFRGALTDTPFVVDYADSGADGILLMKKKEYGVVICNRTEQNNVINYVFESCPNTFCILNAVTLNKGDLHFYLNARHVYRIFLAPVNYRQDMLPVIWQAMLEYEVLKTNSVEEQAMVQREEEKKSALQAALKTIGEEEEKWKDVERTSIHFMERSLFYEGRELPKEQQKDIWNFENMILQHLSFFMKHRDITAEKLQDIIQTRLNQNGEDRNFSVVCPQEVLREGSDYLFARTWFFSWLVAYRMSLLTESYIIRTEMNKVKLKEYKISIICYLPKGTWDKQTRDMGSNKISSVTLSVLEEFATECVTVADEYEVIYHLMVRDDQE